MNDIGNNITVCIRHGSVRSFRKDRRDGISYLRFFALRAAFFFFLGANLRFANA